MPQVEQERRKRGAKPHSEACLPVNTLLPPRQIERLDQIAGAEGRSRSSLIREAIDRWAGTTPETQG